MKILKIAVKSLIAPLIVLFIALFIWAFMSSSKWAIEQAVSGSTLYASGVALGWIFIFSFCVGLVRHFSQNRELENGGTQK